MYTHSKNSSTGFEKLTKTLPDPHIIIDGKNLSIDQWLFKMQSKFEINLDHYPTNRSKLIYVENKLREKVLEYLETSLQSNLITLFATIKDLFNYLEDIFGNFHWKVYTIEKF